MSAIGNMDQSGLGVTTELAEVAELIRRELEANLACLEDPGCEIERKEGEREVVARDGQFSYQPESGYPVPISVGELLTEGDWGNQYWLNPSTVDLDLRRKYLEKEAERRLAVLLDRGIIEEKLASTTLDLKKRGAYEAIRLRLEKGAVSDGELAEQMVHGFIEQLSLDIKGSGFSVLRASASDDVELHVDFAVHRITDPKNRGIGVDRGVQFTINDSITAQARKTSQLEKTNHKLGDGSPVDEVVLVTIPLKDVRVLYDEWTEAGKPPGGPQKRWTRRLKEEIVTKVLGAHGNATFLNSKSIKKILEQLA